MICSYVLCLSSFWNWLAAAFYYIIAFSTKDSIIPDDFQLISNSTWWRLFGFSNSSYFSVRTFSTREFLGEVHHLASVLVDRDGAGHGRRSAVFRSAREVRALARVVLLFDQVITSPESHQVSVVGGSGDRDGAGAADVRVAKLE